jgi:PAS domain S-box-containing protein
VTPSAIGELERRILVLVTTTKDASLTRGILQRAGIACTVCGDLDTVVRELEAGAGALLVAEECVSYERAGDLIALIRRQPPWSDLPVLLLTRQGADSPEAMQAPDTLGNVTLLERPTRVNSLVSVVRAALRARERQYQARARLTELEHATDAIWESEKRHRMLVEQVKDYAIFMVDPQGRPTSWNEGVKRVFGFDESEFLGSEIYSQIFTPEDVRKGVPQRELEEATTNGIARGDRWMRRKDGSQFWASGITTALRDAQGTLVGFTKVKRDLTDRKLAEDAQKRAERTKDEFLATLAHELRNPLAPIRNSLHIMRLAGDNDPTLRRVSEIMERQVDHMVRLVDDLLEVSRITRGQIELRKEPIELAAVVSRAVETSRPLIDAGRHQLAISLPTEPVLVDGDSVRLAQVVSNLLNNAAKYTNHGGQIWLSVRKEESQAWISVRDTGIGIPAAMQPLVFEMFSQVDRFSSRSQGGLGIGLTLVRSLVEMHGGEVHLKSEGTDHGSEFIVRLPLCIETAHAANSAAPRIASMVLARQRVVVVDDNRDAATSMGLLLKILGADVEVVNSGPAALLAVESYRPAVVLLDLGMPEMDGYEVAKRIRERPEFDDVMLIALTGWGQDDDRRRAHEAGFDHHLVKPADISSLQELLQSRQSDAGNL